MTVNASGVTTFGQAVGGLQALTSLTTDAAGTTQLDSGGVRTTGDQTYQDAVTLGADVALAGVNVTFGRTLDDGGVAGNANLTVNASGVTTFGQAVGGLQALTGLTTDAGGSTQLDGGVVRTTGDQTYLDAVTLGADATLTGVNVRFTNTLNDDATAGNANLTINASGVTMFDQAVGGLRALTSLTADAAGTTQLDGGVVRTTGDQTYQDAVTLGADATLTSVNVRFTNTLNDDGTAGNANLTINASGVTMFGQAVGGLQALTGLTTDAAGTTQLDGGGVRTAGDQTYQDAVTLGSDATLTGVNVTFGRTLDGGGVGGNANLTVNASGVTTFGQAVGGLQALTSLTTDAGGSTQLDGGLMRTTGDQRYQDAVTLGADATLTGLNVSFTGTLNDGGAAGNASLTVNAGGVTTFGQAVGGVQALTSLTTDAAGTTQVNGGEVRTVGDQTYQDAVTLGADATLTGVNVRFTNTLNDDATAGNAKLTVNASGDTTFDQAVGGLQALSSLTTDAAGTTQLDGGLVRTTGDQTYQDAVTLGSDATLTGVNVTFGRTLDGGGVAGNANLTVNASGVTTFGQAVGGLQALTSLTTDAGGSTQLDGGLMRTTGDQRYQDAVTLGADATLTGLNVSFTGTLNDGGAAGNASLTVNAGGVTTFGQAVGGVQALTSLTTDAAGTTQVNGGEVRTVGDQTYQDAVTLGADATLTGVNVRFTNTLNDDATAGNAKLTVNASGDTTFDQAVGGLQALSSLTTDAAGTTQLDGGLVRTTGDQTYQDAVTLGSNATLTGVNVTFGRTLDDGGVAGNASLTVNAGGVTTFGQAVGGLQALTSLTTDAGGSTQLDGGLMRTTGDQRYQDAVTLGADATLTGLNVSFTGTLNDGGAAGNASLTVNAGGVTAFGQAVGGVQALTSLTTDAAGTTQVNGGEVRTVGDQTYLDAVTLGADATLTGVNVRFTNTLNDDATPGNAKLTVNASGETTFGQTVGGLQALTSLTTDAAGTTQLDGGGVWTAGDQTYQDAVTLGSDATLTGVNVTFGRTLDDGGVAGNANLTVNASGVTTFGQAVGGLQALTSLTTDAGGSTQLDGGLVRTTGDQRYQDGVTLGADATLTGVNVRFTNTLNDDATAGNANLAINASGVTTFGQAVGGLQALTSLTTDAAGTMQLDGGVVRTTGDQTYLDAVTLGADATLTGVNVRFTNTLNDDATPGNANLTINASGVTMFDRAVGGVQALTSLTTDAAGTTQFDGGVVRTAGDQTYQDAVTLGADATLTGVNVRFSNTLNDDATPGNASLTVNASGVTTFGQAVGGLQALTSLTTDAGGSTQLDGGLVRTTGDQRYQDGVTLGADATLTGVNVRFTNTLNDDATPGNANLTINASGVTMFDQAVGGLRALTSLTTDAAGTTQLDGGVVRTTGDQTYQDAVTLGADVVLAGVNVTFGRTLDDGGVAGNANLTVNASGVTTFGQAVGGLQALTSLTTDAAGTTQLDGGVVRTTGDQTYQDAVTLGADATLTGASVRFANTLNDDATPGNANLTINASGVTTFGQAVGGVQALTSLTTDTAGTTQFDGGVVRTAGDQTYLDAVTLGADATVTGANVRFASTLNDDATPGNAGLTVNASGVTMFDRAVGGLQALTSLTTDAAGTTQLDGGGVRTTGDQTYQDAVTLGADVALTGVNVTFGRTLDDGGVAGNANLTVNASGVTTFGQAVGGLQALTSLTTDAGGSTQLDSGLVRTTGDQRYQDAVTLGSDATLTGLNVSFTGTLNDGGAAGNASLTVNAGGVTAFGQAVGDVQALTSLTTDAVGTTQVNGGVVRTVGDQTYQDAVTLGADATLTGVNVRFTNTLNDDGTAGNANLTINASGVTMFDRAVGGLQALTSLTTDAAGTTQLDGGGVRTTGDQTYQDAVTLGADVALTGVNVTFGRTLDEGGVAGNANLTVNASGVTTFGQAVGGLQALTSLTTDAGGSTQLDSGLVRTTGDQRYQDAVTLGSDATLTGLNVSFTGTLNDGGAAGNASLTVNAGGVTAFGQAVGDVQALTSLTTDAVGTTQVNGGVVRTAGDQTYQDAVTLGADATLTGVNVRFASTLNDDATLGNASLTVNASSVTTFGQAVGGLQALTSLTTDAAGTTQLDGGVVRTTGDQTYQDAVTLGADATLTGVNVRFTNTLNDDGTAGNANLTINASGVTMFDRAVGGLQALTSLTTDAAGTTQLDGGGVRTTGDQTYQDAVTLGADATLTGVNVTFGRTLDDGGVAGNANLTVNASGVTTFGQAVGGLQALTSLTTDAGGSTQLDGGLVRTTGDQRYQDAVTLGSDATLTGLNVSFTGTLNDGGAAGNASLTVNAGGVTTFGQAVGGVQALTSLTTDAAGTTQVNGGEVRTVGDQTYQDAVTLGADATLTGLNVNFTGTLNDDATPGNAKLTVNASGETTFGRAVGGLQALSSLTTDAAGTTQLDGGLVRTTGDQTYQDAVTLGADAMLTGATCVSRTP